MEDDAGMPYSAAMMLAEVSSLLRLKKGDTPTRSTYSTAPAALQIEKIERTAEENMTQIKRSK